METEHTDVLVVGAGLSGIGAAAHLRAESPDRSVTTHFRGTAGHSAGCAATTP